MVIKRSKLIVYVICFLIVTIAALNLLTVFRTGLPLRIQIVREILPFEVRSAGRLFTVLTSFALFILATSLLRRKRIAWGITIAVLLVNALAHVIKSLDVEEAAISFLMAGVLFLNQKYFIAKSDPPSISSGIKILLFALIFSLAYGTLGFYFLDRHFNLKFSLAASFEETIKIFFLTADTAKIPLTRFGHWFIDSLYFIGISTSAYSFLMLLRPVIFRGVTNDKELRRVKEIFEKYSENSIEAFALLPKRHHFLVDGLDAFINFKVVGRIALSLGGPCGWKADRPKIIRQFLDYCAVQGWQPVFFQINPEDIGFYERKGFKTVSIGHEAIIHLKDFSLAGKSMRSLRYGLGFMEKNGYTVRLFEPSLDNLTLYSLRAISNEWLKRVHGTEKHFTVGAFDWEYLKNSLVMVMFEPNGKIAAFVNILKYGEDNLTIDLMRQKNDLPPDAMLYLFVKMILWAQSAGYRDLSLGEATLYGVGKKDSPVIEKAFRLVFERFNQFYNFKGLYTFKSKFHPDWQARFMAYPNLIEFSSAIFALLRADSSRK